MSLPPKVVVVLRWLGVVPAAFAAQFLLFGLGMLLWSVRTAGPTALDLLGLEAFSGAAFVYGGTCVAPSHRKPVAILLLATFVIVSITQTDWGLLGLAAALAGAGVGAFFGAGLEGAKFPASDATVE